MQGTARNHWMGAKHSWWHVCVRNGVHVRSDKMGEHLTSMNLTSTIPTRVILNDRHEWMHETDALRIFVTVDSWSAVLIFTYINSICSCLFQITVHMFLSFSHSTWFWDCIVCPFSLLPCLFLVQIEVEMSPKPPGPWMNVLSQHLLEIV